MEAHHACDAGIFQAAMFDHSVRAANRFLGRLEKELHCAGQLRFHAFENLRGAEEDRCVDVMPAGMHYARNL